MTIVVASRRVLLEKNAELTLAPAFIEIEKERIVRVVEESSARYLSRIREYKKQKSVVHQFDDAVVTPAFVNAHTHVAMSFFRGLQSNLSARKNMIEDVFFRIESSLTEDDVYAFARMGAYECLLNGVGAVWDHYYFGKAVANALFDVGVCGYVAPTLQDVSGPGVGICERMLSESKDIADSKKFQKAGIFAALGPHASDTVSKELWKTIVEKADRWNLPIHGHLAQSAEEYERCRVRHRCSPVEWLSRLGVLRRSENLWAHAIYVDKKDLRLIRNSKNTLVFCPSSQVQFQFPARVDCWEAADVRWCVASDCVASSDSMNVQKELRYLNAFSPLSVTLGERFELFMQKGKLPKKNLKTKIKYQTSRELLARIFNVPGEIASRGQFGAFKKNAIANLVVWDPMHPTLWPALDIPRALAFNDCSGAIQNVMTAGIFRGETGNFASSILQSKEYRTSLLHAEKLIGDRHLRP